MPVTSCNASTVLCNINNNINNNTITSVNMLCNCDYISRDIPHGSFSCYIFSCVDEVGFGA